MADRTNEAGASGFKATRDPHVDEQSSDRVPTPDPKDQTGDPEADNPAMQELRKRQSQRDISES
jgi:hypothetical protein